MLKVINVYQILSSILVMIMFVIGIPNMTEGLDFYNGFITVILFIIGGLLIFTNWYLLMGKIEWRLKFLKFNQYVNLFQVLTISLFGLSYDFVFGPRLMPYLSYANTIDVRFFADFINSRLSLFYKPSTIILVGVNFIPLILLIILSSQYKKYAKES